MSFHILIKGITPEIRMSCFVLINSVLLNLLSVWTLQLCVLPCLARVCHSVTFGETVSVKVSFVLALSRHDSDDSRAFPLWVACSHCCRQNRSAAVVFRRCRVEFILIWHIIQRDLIYQSAFLRTYYLLPKFRRHYITIIIKLIIIIDCLWRTITKKAGMLTTDTRILLHGFQRECLGWHVPLPHAVYETVFKRKLHERYNFIACEMVRLTKFYLN